MSNLTEPKSETPFNIDLIKGLRIEANQSSCLYKKTNIMPLVRFGIDVYGCA